MKATENLAFYKCAAYGIICFLNKRDDTAVF